MLMHMCVLQEMNYLCCAKAMCNLACNQDINIRLAHDGGIYALLMIALVSSVEVAPDYLSCILFYYFSVIS